MVPGAASTRASGEAVTDDERTSGAAQLAERILDEVSSPGQNWCRVAALARELAALADAASPPGRGRSRTEEP
jgi:hypothetical protein